MATGRELHDSIAMHLCFKARRFNLANLSLQPIASGYRFHGEKRFSFVPSWPQCSSYVARSAHGPSRETEMALALQLSFAMWGMIICAGLEIAHWAS